MAKTYVDQETCIACEACYSTCPGVYESDDDGYSFVKLPGGLKDFVEVPKEFVSKAMSARDECPTESIRWID
ncbi:ferredoxin [Aneurinibacillus soli]|uniref:Ferredoxin n=1 Tax=Aneurinibacillus soli TaxID=1500254 RepID=A0A0U5B386_9BACL|nr:ferredoxin [Aneurinibacillus soli]PYE57371.1 ferredoxin [Aneurinibacillus soli]BAU28768.1 Ferredoxin [Aneurinibacillus soli]